MTTAVEVIRKMGVMGMDEFIKLVHNLTVRYWIKGENDGKECLYGRITNAIHIGGAKWLIGISPDKGAISKPDYDSISFYDFDSLFIEFVNMDQD